MVISLTDNGGRRVEGDRRLLKQMNYHPERRSGMDRRKLRDRRSLSEFGVLRTSENCMKERRGIFDLLGA